MKKFISVLLLVSLVIMALAAVVPVYAASGPQIEQGPQSQVQVPEPEMPGTAGDLVVTLLQSILAVVIPIGAYYLKALADQQIEKAKAATTAEKYQLARGMVYDLVQSARQRGLNNEIDNSGKALKRYVVNRAADLFKTYNLPFDAAEIVDLLESSYVNMTSPVFGTIQKELDQSAPPSEA